MPPYRTSSSTAQPSAGFAVIPEAPSEPPQFVARISSEIGWRVRRASLATGRRSCTALIPASTVLRTPPDSWIERTRGLPSFWRSMKGTVWFTSHPSPMRT